MGDSRGRWEGDTLAVSVRHFTVDTWFDRAGNFHSEAMQLTERYSFFDRDTIRCEVTVEDPKIYAPLEDEHAALPPEGAELPAARICLLCLRRRGGRDQALRQHPAAAVEGRGAP